MPEERKTLNTPVDAATLARFAHLDEADAQLCRRFVNLENEKIRILAALKRLEEERSTMFQTVLVDRGLSPDTSIEIDPETGVLSLEQPSKAPNPEPDPAAGVPTVDG